MSHVIFLFFFLSALPFLINSLQCYTCNAPFTLNYIVTSDTVPKFNNCRLVNATQCAISVIWLPKLPRTVITLRYRSVPLTNDTLRDYILPMTLLLRTLGEDTLVTSHDLEFGCVS